MFIALGIQLFVAVTYAAGKDDEHFSVDYCGMNCTQQEDGSWTACSGRNEECRCYHESGKKNGLCLSTTYIDFSQYGNPSDSDIAAASPRP
uniref:Evasin P1128 n=1 Tax=Ixodes ricinus TaxID=34613 RepID=E1128_IXORI|nr:RecName: Full=Evasin P1128; Flags: Precursor [Ixodes ricinus]